MDNRQSIVSAVVLLVLELAGLCGVAIDQNLLTTIVGVIACVASLGWGIWRNHNLTGEAVQAQTILNALKEDDGETVKAVAELVETIKTRKEGQHE